MWTRTATSGCRSREDEHGQLEPDDEEHDRPVEVPVVVYGSCLVEPQVPGEPPGRGDEGRVDRDLPDR